MFCKLNKVRIEGFKSIGEMTIDLFNRGVVMVQGINDFDKNFLSNGAGKSAGFEAILWCLAETTYSAFTTKAIQKDRIYNSVVNHALVEVDMDVDGKNYVITRTRNHPEYGNHLMIKEDGVDISADNQTKSNQILYSKFPFLTSNLIMSIMILGAGMPNKFSSMSPSTRKSMLEEMSRSTEFVEDFKKRVSRSYDKYYSELTKINEEITTINTTISNAQDMITKKNNEIDLITSKISYKSSVDIEKLRMEIDLLSKKPDEIDKDVRKLSEDLTTLRNLSYKRSTDLSNKKRESESLKSEMKSLSAKNCPYCKNPITSEEFVATKTKEISERLEILKTEIDALNNIEERSQKLISDKTREKEVLEAKKRKIEESIREKQQQLLDAQSDSSMVTYLKNEIEELNKRINDNAVKKSSLETKHKELSSKCDILSWMKLAASKDLRSFLLDGVIAYMNKRLDYYSQLVYDEPGIVRLEPYGNEILIYYKNRLYEEMSTGEAKRVDICVQFALRDLSISEAKVGFNILVLDEVLDALDDIGVQSVLKILSNIPSDLVSVFLISHRSDLLIPYDDKMIVRKGPDGTSRLIS